MGCRRRVVNHWLDKDFRFGIFLHSATRQDLDLSASAFSSVQLWGQGWLSIMKMGSECVLMYFLQFVQIIRYEKRKKNYYDCNI